MRSNEKRNRKNKAPDYEGNRITTKATPREREADLRAVKEVKKLDLGKVIKLPQGASPNFKKITNNEST